MIKVLLIGSFVLVILISIGLLIFGLVNKRKIIWIPGAILIAASLLGCIYANLYY